MNSNDLDHQHGLGWIHRGELTSAQTTGSPRTPATGDEWQWLESPAPRPRGDSSEPSRSESRSRTVKFALATGIVVVVAATALLADDHRRANTDNVDVAPAIPMTRQNSTPTPVSTAPPSTACSGLSGATITDGPGDITSAAGVIAAFDYAYYRHRDPAEALRLAAPEAGLTLDSLASGIGSIPTGTTHCVAVTPIAETTAHVHLSEVRLDGSRIDYLQLVNTRRDGAAVLITNIQKR